MEYEKMTKKELIQALKYHKSNYEFYKSIADRLEKKLDLLKISITSFSAIDLDFIHNFNLKNKDKSLHDFFNKILYSFGRPDDSGICKTVIGRS